MHGRMRKTALADYELISGIEVEFQDGELTCWSASQQTLGPNPQSNTTVRMIARVTASGRRSSSAAPASASASAAACSCVCQLM